MHPLVRELEACSDTVKAGNTARLVKTRDRILGVPGKTVDRMAAGNSQKVTDPELDSLFRQPVLEAKILAAKIMGRRIRRDPGKYFRMIDSWLGIVDNWAVCDVLATQGIRKSIPGREEIVLEFIGREYEKKGAYRKRFAIVASISLARQGRPEKALELIKRAKEEKDRMIRKAVEWAEREVSKLNLNSNAKK